MPKLTARAARLVSDAERHLAAGNPESASRVLGNLYRSALSDRDARAAQDAAARLGVPLFACEGV